MITYFAYIARIIATINEGLLCKYSYYYQSNTIKCDKKKYFFIIEYTLKTVYFKWRIKGRSI